MVAVAILAAELLLVGIGAVLGGLIHQLSPEDYWLGAFVGLAFTGVGALVACRRPSERMGWLMLGVGGLWALSNAAGEYAVLDYRFHHGQLPLGGLAVVCQLAWALALFLFALSIVLFPDGRPSSPRWRWPLRALGAISALWVVAAAVAVIPLIVEGTVRVTSDGEVAQLNPPTTVSERLYGITLALLGIGCALTITAWLVSQAFTYRGLVGERRIQQKWILAGAATSFLMVVASFALGSSTLSNFTGLGIVAMPVAMGVGILKYRLYEIDRIVSRTVAYAIVTTVLVATFIALVALTTDVLSFSSSVGVAASTLAAAALLHPLRVRVQRVVDRRFNRARYDAEATVNAFAARLRDAVDIDAVESDLLNTVHQALQPASASVWIRGRL
jgi:hypothetical protein